VRLVGWVGRVPCGRRFGGALTADTARERGRDQPRWLWAICVAEDAEDAGRVEVNPSRRAMRVDWREVRVQASADLLAEPIYSGVAPAGDARPVSAEQLRPHVGCRTSLVTSGCGRRQDDYKNHRAG